MNREDVLLCVLAAADGRSLSPVQLQKSVFLITANLPHLVKRGPTFDFVAYDYGPFDKQVYSCAAQLAQQGLADVSPSSQGRWSKYGATSQGLAVARQMSAQLRPAEAEYISKVVAWVLQQSFGSLVKSIYEAYPQMKTNSIFQG